MVIFVKSDCIRAKVVVFRQSGCIRVKVVVFGLKLLHSGKSDCIRAEWFYSGKVVVSGKSGCIRKKVVVLGQSG